jgi:hypothetical protein
MKNARRIVNILSGNYTGKSKISTGYKCKDIERVEGDIWEEGDRTWTIKDGIKRTINKMTALRKLSQSPLSCPKCNTTIRHWQDEKAYMLLGKCYTCQLKSEHKLRVNNTYDDFIKEKRTNNIEGWMGDAEIEFESYLENIDNKSYVTENGQIEDWKINVDKKELSNKFNTKIDNIKKTIEK